MNFSSGIGIGILLCMFFDVIFAITNYFIEKALYYRNLRKENNSANYTK